MLIATKPQTDRDEIKGQIEWLADLRETIYAGDIAVALEAIDAAIRLLRRMGEKQEK